MYFTLITIFRKELETYIKRKGFKDPGLHKLASALLAYLEVECSNIAPITIFSPSFPFSASAFILGMWASVRALEPRESDNVSEDNSQLLIWAEVFKMNCVLRRYVGDACFNAIFLEIGDKGFDVVLYLLRAKIERVTTDRALGELRIEAQ